MKFLKDILLSFTQILSALTVLLVILIKCSIFEDITLGQFGTLLIFMSAAASLFNCSIDRLFNNETLKHITGAVGTTLIMYGAIALSGFFVIEPLYLITIFLMVVFIYILVWCMELFLSRKTVDELNKKLDDINKK